MSDTKTDLDRAREQGQAQFNSILGMVKQLEEAADLSMDTTYEMAREAIEQDALSVEIRYDWHSPGTKPEDTGAEFRILLCTGGPACQIIGELDEHNEPSKARLQVQDWFTPWTDIRPTAPDGIDTEQTLLAYARVFYFGE